MIRTTAHVEAGASEAGSSEAGASEAGASDAGASETEFRELHEEATETSPRRRGGERGVSPTADLQFD